MEKLEKKFLLKTELAEVLNKDRQQELENDLKVIKKVTSYFIKREAEQKNFIETLEKSNEKLGKDK